MDDSEYADILFYLTTEKTFPSHYYPVQTGRISCESKQTWGDVYKERRRTFAERCSHYIARDGVLLRKPKELDERVRDI